MVLEQLSGGASRRLFVFDDRSRRLAFILCLPLIDGVFATLLVTGAANTFAQMFNIAVTVFAGAGALAVLYSESEDWRDALRMTYSVAPILVAGALLVALIAPVFETVFETVFDVGLLKDAAALTLIVIGFQISEVDLADKLPPTAIILTGLLLSYQGFGGLEMTLNYLYPALITVGLALAGLGIASLLKGFDMNLDYVRYGESVVLFTLALSLFGVEIPGSFSTLVFAVSILGSLKK